jgi:acetylornithine/succinyldiaminopimelate/putrescine aminotransferase
LVIAKWDFVFVAPPLTIDEAQINEALNALDDVLTYTDSVIAGRRTDCRSQHG